MKIANSSILKKVSVLPIFIFFLLNGCASSDVTRNAESQVDNTYLSANEELSQIQSSSIIGTYQNSGETTKGIIVGGATGAIIGGLDSTIGIGPGLLAGAILGGAVGAYMNAHATLADQLQNRGGKVIVLGDQVMVELPSSNVFQPGTPNIRSNAYSTLDIVAKYVSLYPNMSVRVAVYTGATGSPEVNYSLTQEQANVIVKYLWNRGIDTRFLSASGEGGTHLVSPNTGNWMSQNNRIEITLEKLPV